MQEHKYRVWIEKRKTMIYYNNLHYFDGGLRANPGYSNIWDKKLRDEEFDWVEDPPILMQCIDLKDKNKKDMYVKDIIRELTGVLFEVQFYNGSFGYKVLDNYKQKCNYQYDFVNSFVGRHFEVIGNTLENTMLLNSLLKADDTPSV